MVNPIEMDREMGFLYNAKIIAAGIKNNKNVIKADIYNPFFCFLINFSLIIP